MLLRENITGQEPLVKTEFNIVREGDVLHCYWYAHDSSLTSYGDIDNAELYNGDVVEIFIDVGDGNSYLEIEVAPNGKKFVAKIINREIFFIDNSFVKSNVEIRDHDYIVTMDIDLSRFNVKDTIEYNVFRVETCGKSPNFVLSALSPTYCGSFHVRDKFILLKK